MQNKIKPIAIYLPQFHTIPENDEWWGKGFTEWTNVRKATPRFKGHYQPHVPLNENYYYLDNVEVMRNQAKMAKEYGIYGFCFYHYWFNGKLLLEKPLHQWLENKDIDFPYCLSWANENWTRRWDGKDKELLIGQNYSLEDDKEHIRYLMKFFKDDRYIKVDNKPMLLMYRSESHPNIKEATDLWREEAIKAGFDDLYLVRTENFERNIDPSEHGFDAGMEFAPDSTLQGKKIHKKKMGEYLIRKFLHNSGIKKDQIYENGIYDYPTMKSNMISRNIPDYPYFRCSCPSWDNSARRKQNAIIYNDSSPEEFKDWLNSISKLTQTYLPDNQQYIFINAWNEWAEGCHLEPDTKWDSKYLEAVKEVFKMEMD
ncbi:glycoside hydrolase family 99-like domain-containing protein [Echinicola sediminis]